MKSFYSKLEIWLQGPFSNIITRFVKNPYVMALQNAFQIVLPMILVGSIGNLIATLKKFWNFIPDLSFVNTFTFGGIAIYLAFILPYNVMENTGQKRQKIIAGFSGIMALMYFINPIEKKDNIFTINLSYLGASGMTVALIIGLLIGWLFSVYFKHGIFSKNTQLPPIVVDWFESIIPIALLAFICYMVAQYIDVFNIIQQIVTPLAKIGNTYLGFLLLYFIMALCYVLGLSAWAIYPIFLALGLNNIAANAAAVASGHSPEFITTVEVVFVGWCCIGGMGSTLPLNILMLTSKSKKTNAIAKAAIIPALFNINEPIMYGLPVVWNPLMMIPYLGLAIINPTIVYITFKLNLVSIPARIFQMNYLPQPIATFLTNYDWRGVILWIVLFLIALVVYYPFLQAYDKQEIQKELT